MITNHAVRVKFYQKKKSWPVTNIYWNLVCCDCLQSSYKRKEKSSVSKINRGEPEKNPASNFYTIT